MPRPLPCTPEILARKTIERFQKGQLTVSYLDWVQDLDREHDADFANRAVDQLLEVANLVEARGYPCTAVNAYCVRYFAEKVITNEATARKCNSYSSGGKRPVGLRVARSGDLVRGGVNLSGLHLNIGGANHHMQANINDVALGITPPEMHQRLQKSVREELPKLLRIKADPVQGELPASSEDDA